MELLLSGFADEAGVTIEEQMDVLENNGLKHIEMRNVNGKHVLEWSNRALAVIKAKMDKRGFKLSAIGSPVGKSKIEAPFKADIKRFKRAVYCAKFFGCKYIRAFSFFVPECGNRDAYWDEAVSRIKQMVKIAEENDLVYALENESGIFTDTIEPCVRIFEEIKSPAFRMAFDPGNFIVNGVKPFPDAYNALKDKIAYFHIKDVKDGQCVPAGEGDANMPALLKAAYDDGFNGFLSVEPHLGYMDMSMLGQFTIACLMLKICIDKGLGADGTPIYLL